jgi:hypothetical protein
MDFEDAPPMFSSGGDLTVGVSGYLYVFFCCCLGLGNVYDWISWMCGGGGSVFISLCA